MRNRWLLFVSIGVVTALVFVLFVVRLMPVKPTKATPRVEAGSLSEPTVTFVNPSRGAANAAVTIVEFSDFECPACKQLNTSMEIVLRSYGSDVRQVWKNMPNTSTHPTALAAAVAAQCAFQQNKFWEYHDEVFNRQTYLTTDQLTQIGQDIGLNMDAFSKCLTTQDTLPTVQRDYDEGIALGILATPTIYINGTAYTGALTTEKLTAYVEAAMAGK
jgi:protein-disulfide isomerase